MLCVGSVAVESDQWPSVPSMCNHVFGGQVKGTPGAAATGAGVEGRASAAGPHLHPASFPLSGSSSLFTHHDFPVTGGGGWKGSGAEGQVCCSMSHPFQSLLREVEVAG